MSNDVKPVDVVAIRARADAATAGPWRRVSSLGIDSEVGAGPSDMPTLCAEIHAFPGGGDPRSDADFIAAARADVPAMADEIERLRAGVKLAISTMEGTPTSFLFTLPELRALLPEVGK